MRYDSCPANIHVSYLESSSQVYVALFPPASEYYNA